MQTTTHDSKRCKPSIRSEMGHAARSSGNRNLSAICGQWGLPRAKRSPNGKICEATAHTGGARAQAYDFRDSDRDARLGAACRASEASPDVPARHHCRLLPPHRSIKSAHCPVWGHLKLREQSPVAQDPLRCR
eukprot:scaffold377_cov563-Prasinococcus_capsulatus_cf.AAC.15